MSSERRSNKRTNVQLVPRHLLSILQMCMHTASSACVVEGFDNA